MLEPSGLPLRARPRSRKRRFCSEAERLWLLGYGSEMLKDLFFTWCEDLYLGRVENVHLFLGRHPLVSIVAPCKRAIHFLKIVGFVIKIVASLSDEPGRPCRLQRCRCRSAQTPEGRAWTPAPGARLVSPGPQPGSTFIQLAGQLCFYKRELCYRDQLPDLQPMNLYTRFQGCWWRNSSVTPEQSSIFSAS